MATGTDFNKSTTSVNNLYKIDYQALGEKVYNNANIFTAMVKKTTHHEGDVIHRPIHFGFAGSVGGGAGSATLPESSGYKTVNKAIIDVFPIYARAYVDRLSIQKAKSGKNAYFRELNMAISQTLESWNRNRERIWFGDGSGELCAGDGATNVTGAGTTASPYTVVLGSSTIEANVEEDDLWNYDAESTTLRVVSYTPSTFTVELVGTSAGLATLAGSGPVPTTKFFYMQGSKDVEPKGLAILKKTSGTYYNISIANRKWKPVQKDASSAAIDETLINEMLANMEIKTGKLPNAVVTSYKQYEKLKNLQVDLKRHAIKAGPAQLSFPGAMISTDKGDIKVIPNRFCPPGDMYFLNMNHIEVIRTPGGGWFDDDGTVFMRVADLDKYEARYGQYFENYIQPSHQGVIYNLKTT